MDITKLVIRRYVLQHLSVLTVLLLKAFIDRTLDKFRRLENLSSVKNVNSTYLLPPPDAVNIQQTPTIHCGKTEHFTTLITCLSLTVLAA